ncbi:hypothetical protein Bca52824_088752 [Brassica carinata]|nr:hypothetical protein Bca52824_088752 [Brassica carinata]
MPGMYAVVESSWELICSYWIVRGTGYPDLWPSPSCREPLDVTKNFTFDVIAGILADMRKIFPFEFITWAVMK